jgi:hypothetical protein
LAKEHSRFTFDGSGRDVTNASLLLKLIYYIVIQRVKHPMMLNFR